MNSLGLYTGLDMRNQSLEFMQANFGKAGSVLLLDLAGRRQPRGPRRPDPKNLVRALRHQDAVPFKISARTQAALDAWIRKRLAAPGEEFRNELSLAADAGSSSSATTQIAKWALDHVARSLFLR